jgi:selenocysteine lyase/cysteine desulfurase
MAGHLFGIQLHGHDNPAGMIEQLQQERISVSLRGNFLRISPHVYNSQADMDKLCSILND